MKIRAVVPETVVLPSSTLVFDEQHALAKSIAGFDFETKRVIDTTRPSGTIDLAYFTFYDADHAALFKLSWGVHG